MTTKIRIVLDDAEDLLDKVQAFVATLSGVQTAALLKDGEDLLATVEGAPAPEPPAEATPPLTEPATVEAPVEAPTAAEFVAGPDAEATPAEAPVAPSEPVQPS